MEQKAYTEVMEMMIREHHIDSYGHVNNAAYAEIFEEARWDLITKNGYGVKKVQELQQGPVMLEMQIRFSREVSVREKIRIVSECVSYHKKIFKMKQTIYKEDGTAACEGNFIGGLFDLKTRKLILPTPEWLKAVGLG